MNFCIKLVTNPEVDNAELVSLCVKVIHSLKSSELMSKITSVHLGQYDNDKEDYTVEIIE